LQLMLRALALLSVVLVRMSAVAAVIFEDGTFEPVQWEVTQVGSPTCGEDSFFSVACADAQVSGPCGCSQVSQEPVGGFGGTYRRIDLVLLGDGPITWFHHPKDATYDPRGPQGPLVSLDYAEDALGAVDDEDVGSCGSEVGAEGQATGPAVRQNGTTYIRPGLFTACAWTHEELRGLMADDFVAIDGCCEPHPDFSGQGPEADARLELGFFRANAHLEVVGFPTAPHATGGGIDNFRMALDPVCVTDEDCDDRDECTSDTCAGGRCMRARLPGFDVVRCELRRALTALPGVCGSEQPPAKLQSRLGARLARTERLLAERRGGRAARRRKRRGLRLLGGAAGLVRSSETLDRGCQLPLYGLITDLEILLAQVDLRK